MKLNGGGWQRTWRRGRGIPLPPLVFGLLAVPCSKIPHEVGACVGSAMFGEGGLAVRR